MGNTQTPGGADHDFYRRPADGIEPGRERQPSVQIIDDGADAGAVPGGAAPYSGLPGGSGDRTQDLAVPDKRAVPDNEEQAQRNLQSSPRSRFNYSLAAAWVLVGLLLAHGLLWLTGSFPVPQFDPTTGISTDEMPSAMVMNLSSMGPAPFLFGLVGAFTLLTVQAAGFRQKARP